ncbi:MAG TPA: methionine synthase [Candidatus Dormibacteraeota bacterium]|nr:methionine synthase [Candidatus Dormibacteraeota bacterium]
MESQSDTANSMPTLGCRADHVGSLLRPAGLLEAMSRAREGLIDPETLRRVQDEAILGALDLQRQVGLGIFTDGEFRRSWFAGAWSESIGGLAPAERPAPAGPAGWRGPHRELARVALGEVGTSHAVVDRVRPLRRLAQEECAFLREHAPGPFKITLAGVVSQALRWYRPGLSDRAYPTLGDLISDLAGILRAEVEALAQEGVSYLQLDSLVYTIQLADAAHRARLVEAGVDPDWLLEQAIAADNAVLAPARSRPGLCLGLHMCRGNNRSAWTADGSYEAVAERAFSELRVDRLLLEYDSERAGGFEPLRFVSKDKVVVLGLVSTKVPTLESQDWLLRRIEEAARYVPVERLALSPQCGFASTARGNLLGEDDQRRKLELVVETARRVWGDA